MKYVPLICNTKDADAHMGVVPDCFPQIFTRTASWFIGNKEEYIKTEFDLRVVGGIVAFVHSNYRKSTQETLNRLVNEKSISSL